MGWGQLVNGEVSLFDKITGEAVSGGCVPRGTYSQQSPKWSCFVTLIASRLSSESEAGDIMTNLYYLGEGC